MVKLRIDDRHKIPSTTNQLTTHSFTYDHGTMRSRLPVRSALVKHCTGGLVVRWVTTSESPLLYVFALTLSFLLKETVKTAGTWVNL
jgi:hypothetical protein